jgi:hypothetical protein
MRPLESAGTPSQSIQFTLELIETTYLDVHFPLTPQRLFADRPYNACDHITRMLFDRTARRDSFNKGQSSFDWPGERDPPATASEAKPPSSARRPVGLVHRRRGTFAFAEASRTRAKPISHWWIARAACGGDFCRDLKRWTPPDGSWPAKANTVPDVHIQLAIVIFLLTKPRRSVKSLRERISGFDR